MSRTVKGEKGPGYDYGGSRLSPHYIECPGPGVKRRTHKKSRRRAIEGLRRDPEQVPVKEAF